MEVKDKLRDDLLAFVCVFCFYKILMNFVKKSFLFLHRLLRQIAGHQVIINTDNNFMITSVFICKSLLNLQIHLDILPH